MRAAVYCRVSSEDQVKGSSLQTQEDECRQRAATLGATEVAAYVERGVSGETLERPALSSLREALRAKSVDLVIMYDPDRMARKLSIQLLLTDEITKAGAQLEFVRFDWQDTPDGRLFYALRGAISEYEREKIRERTVRNKRAKVAQGGMINRPRTYGYHFDPVTDTMNPDPETSPVVQQMFVWARDGMGVRGISQRLAQMRVPPPGGRGIWWPETVSRILHSETYRGRLYLNRYSITKEGGHTHQRQRPREEWVEARIPALVDDATWQAAQRALERNARFGRGKREYPCLLRGLLLCAECGGGMTIRTKVKPGKAYCYYQCANAHGKQAFALDGRVVKPCGQMQSVRTEPLDEAVWTRVAAFLADPGPALAEEAGEDPTLARQFDLLKKQAKATDEARERTLHVFQRALIDEGTFEREIRRLQDESLELRRQLEDVRAQQDRRALAAGETKVLRRSLVDLADKADPLDFEERRRVLTLLVERIVVGRDAEGRVTAEIQGFMPLEEQLRAPREGRELREPGGPPRQAQCQPPCATGVDE